MKVQRVRGTRDFVAEEAEKFNFVVEKARGVLLNYGFQEIKTPVIEQRSLFVRTVGPFSDIVEKEMFTIELKDGDVIVLRPEGTAPVARAYIEHGLYVKEPFSRLFYVGPMFRYERPQKGRYREFHQIGAEIIGVEDPSADAEIIKLSADILHACEIEGFSIELNSVGCVRCRPEYVEKLKEFLTAHSSEICDNCKRRKDKNPLRVLDCKNETCRAVYREAPVILDFLCEECREHFSQVQKLLEEVELEFTVNPMIVRGLDYYTRTAFEFTHSRLGAQNAVSAGGRYDGLISELGGPEVPGVGFAMGVERVLEIMVEKKKSEREGVGIILLEKSWKGKALKIAGEIRKNGIRCIMDYRFGSLKSQLRRLDKENVKLVLIAGENEIREGKFTLKDLDTGEQKEVTLENVIEELKGRVG